MSDVRIGYEGVSFRLPSRPIAGEHLRSFLLGSGRTDLELFLEMPGLEEDRVIEYDKTYDLRDGMRFYALPRRILAG